MFNFLNWDSPRLGAVWFRVHQTLSGGDLIIEIWIRSVEISKHSKFVEEMWKVCLFIWWPNEIGVNFFCKVYLKFNSRIPASFLEWVVKNFLLFWRLRRQGEFEQSATTARKLWRKPREKLFEISSLLPAFCW